MTTKNLLQNSFIVLVEDDPNAQLITLDLLRMAGVAHCYSRKSVDSALTFATKLPQIDLFLVDINMPGKSGYELLAEVRASDELKHVKVVAVTAGTLEAEMEYARQLGFDGFISKPLNPIEFPKQIQRVLNGEPVWERS